ncbi:MAG: DNA replication/repair protein RecF [Gammaproteobacteria bacterium]|nr:DNA replication/repair protein RecF [Gammaproteobacteria bacterium]
MLTRLRLHRVRNIAEAELLPGPGFNLIHGDNGAGKTTVLEAIHYLHVGRSFRSHQNQAVIQNGAEQLAVFGQFQLGERQTAVGLSRERGGEWTVKIDGEKRESLSELASICPQLVLTPDSFQLLTAGPKLRRQFLDWGVFHVEHRFLPIWQRWSRSLKQRNAALKTARRYSDVALWDGEYVALATQLAEQRAEYLGHLLPALRALAADFLPDQDLRFGFYAGWDRQQDLGALLASHFETDRRQGFTALGPHKADLRIKLGGHAAQDVLSRGQQKRLVTVLKLAQAKVLKEQTGKPCLFLVDDLPSELDDASRAALLVCLRDYRMQVFLSSITREAIAAFIDPTELTVFHVEHGRVMPE